MKEEVKWVSEAMKFTNSRLHSLEKLNEAMFNALTRLVDLEADKQQGKASKGDGGKSYTV